MPSYLDARHLTITVLVNSVPHYFKRFLYYQTKFGPDMGQGRIRGVVLKMAIIS